MKKDLDKPKIVFCGGHHTSSLPLIDVLLEQGEYDLIFIGRKKAFSDDKNDSLEFLDISKRDIKFYNLKTSKFYGKSLISIFRIIGGFFHALSILIKENPRVIVSFGGYIAVPVVLAGFILRKKIITHEQTVVTGMGNKFISWFADKVLVTWPNSLKYFNKSKTEVIGLPLRKSLFEKSPHLFKSDNKLPTVYITCGKTGSHIINQFILENLNTLLQSFNIIHQSGDYSVTNDFSNLETVYSLIKENVKGKYYLRKFMFDEEVLSAFTDADFVVSRSGAHTIYELLHFKKKSILVPIPWVSFNEQYLNAKILHNVGLGMILEEENFNLDNFLSYTKKILAREVAESAEIEKLVKLNSTQLFIDEIKRQIEIQS
jgi:UDP-N-acetylglucosamine--N-acetylmuramyl-(pentapeptide) pyrophosphoryl-undecaprenol N-acetylglucosamine transferase